MTKKLIRDYLKGLRNRRDNAVGKVSNDIQQKINNVVDLYEDRKITQKSTADKLIDGLVSKNEKKRTKGIREYEKAVEKFENKERVSEKQEEALKKAREGKKEKKAVGIIRRIKEKASIQRLTGEAKAMFKDRKAYSIKYMAFSTERMEKGKQGIKINGKMYYPLLNPVIRTANVKANKFIETLVKRKFTLEDDKALFRRLMMILRTDDEFDRLMRGDIVYYVKAIRIESIEDVCDIGAIDMDIREERLRDGNSNMSIYHRYIETEIDGEYHTIKEALQNRMYRENECWINAFG